MPIKVLVAAEAVILGTQAIMYFGCEMMQQNFRNVLRPVDERIPLVPAFAYIYVLWFPLVALFPLALSFQSRDEYAVYQLSIIISNITSTAMYLYMPTTMDRPVPPDDFFGRSLAIVYRFDFRGCNCSPSLHCVQCFIVSMSIMMCGLREVHWIGVIILCLLIVVSTVLTKQHALRDVIWALPTAVWSYAAGWLIVSYAGTDRLFAVIGL